MFTKDLFLSGFGFDVLESLFGTKVIKFMSWTGHIRVADLDPYWISTGSGCRLSRRRKIHPMSNCDV
jgi:hypothetical protein